MKILITGGSGNLGQELKLISNLTLDLPSRKELDLTNDNLKIGDYDLVIHCAAYTDVAKAEQDKDICFDTNVLGTQRLVNACRVKKNPPRFIHISTDYVFDGAVGNYKEEDIKSPINYYGWTKALAEEEVLKAKLSNFLIIRTSFKSKAPWKYPKAFSDVYTIADYVDVVAPMILEACLDSSLQGIINIGTDKKTIYELAKSRNSFVEPMLSTDVSVPIPKNPYLCLDKWKNKTWK